MNRTCLKFVAAGLLTCLAGGCAWLDPPCDNSGAGGGPNGAGRHAAAAGGGAGGAGGAGAADNQTGVVAYPYYTNRGPRDYFSRPTDIGP